MKTMCNFLETRRTIILHMIAVLFVVFVHLFAGCSAKFNDLVSQKPEGVSFVYPVNEEQAWDISRKVFLKNGARKAEIEESKSDHTINWVGVLVVTIEPLDQTNTRVTAKRPPEACIPTTPRITEKEFHDAFSELLS